MTRAAFIRACGFAMATCVLTLNATADLPEAEVKRLEQIVARRPPSLADLPRGPEFDKIVNENADITIEARRAIQAAVKAGAFSIFRVALQNPEWDICRLGIVDMRDMPQEFRKDFLLFALFNPSWPDPERLEHAMGSESGVQSTVQGYLDRFIFEALGEKEVPFTHHWTLDERMALAKRLHTELNLPYPRGQFSVDPPPGQKGGKSSLTVEMTGPRAQAPEAAQEKLPVHTPEINRVDQKLRHSPVFIAGSLAAILAATWLFLRLKTKK